MEVSSEPIVGDGTRKMSDDAVVPRNYGRAWLALTFAVAIHVTDEAATGFLSLYNPVVRDIRERVPWLPLPTFSFRAWLSGLAAAVLLLLFLARMAFANSPYLRPLAYVFAVMMLGNGLLHIVASISLRRLAPGVVSAPLLLTAASYLLISLRRTARPAPRGASAANV
jgi:hypothetical protein